MAIFSDLREVKAILDIDPANTNEDKKLSLINEWAGDIIEEALNKRPITYKQRVEYPKTAGTRKLLLRARPVYPPNATGPDGNPTVLTVLVNAGAQQPSDFNPATDTWTYGVDYTLDIDQEDGISSRSGILIALGGGTGGGTTFGSYWPRDFVRQAGLLSSFMGEPRAGMVQVTYTAGFTVDNLPASFRVAGALLVARLAYIFPVGMELAGDAYEEKALSFVQERRGYLLSLVAPILWDFRNWYW